MTIKSRTIDNLGIASSVRYAKDQKELDPKLLTESRFVPDKAVVSVTKPLVFPELEEYLSPIRSILWALFPPAPEYSSSTLFTYQLIPSLGSLEEQETDTDKLSALENALKEKKHKKGQSQEQEEREKEKEEAERQTLLTFLECTRKLDRMLELINGRRNQYQRG